MFFERIVSKGLSHYSYIIGDSGRAVVIDPRRDCGIYVRKAYSRGLRISHILETHRHEDFVIGSVELAARTGAEIWHADAQLEYGYGRAAEDGQTWAVGDSKLECIPTPGHTPGSLSYLLRGHSGAPWMLFSGDTLFSGDVGRVDLMGMEIARDMAGKLYDSIFRKLLPLGDEVLLWPAHGAGSVCGSSIADRPWTSLGLERKLNPRLRLRDRAEFISAVSGELERPPYFKRMEEWNLQGPPVMGLPPHPVPLTPRDFEDGLKQGTVVDIRTEEGYGSAHIPGSLSIWEEGLAGFAGWFLPYDHPLFLVSESRYPGGAVRTLIRMGFDNIPGYLAAGMHGWHTRGKASESIPLLLVQKFCRILDHGTEAWILDVRSREELEGEGRIPGAHHIHLTQLPQRIGEVPRDRMVYIFCGSGLRSMTAAGLLKKAGWDKLTVIRGGFAGWISTTCPIKHRE
jgi:hydroxyacylglutathione hydrolase